MEKLKTLFAASLAGVMLVTLVFAAGWMAMANSSNQTGDKIVKPVSKVDTTQSTVTGINNDGYQDTEKPALTGKNDVRDLNEIDTEDNEDQNDVEELGDD